MAKKYRKKMYNRNIRNVKFIEMKRMPFMKNTQDVIVWMRNNNSVMSYLQTSVRDSGILIFDSESWTWKGINYDKPKDDHVTLSETAVFGWRITRLTCFEEAGLDIMPPLHVKENDDVGYDPDKDEVLQYLKDKEAVLRLFFKVATLNGFIVPKEGGWIGVNKNRTL